MKTIIATLALTIFCNIIIAQQDSITIAAPNRLTFSGYLEPYYSYDFSTPDNHLKSSFLYNYNRHNEFNLNLGFIKATYTSDRLRGNLALMTGTYAQYNLAAEPDVLRHIFEANAGVKLSENNEVWLDAGIMPSHIGFESAIGKDNWALTRSLVAENTPYYEAGVRLSYTSRGKKLYLAGLILNGYQRIFRVNSNNTPAFGAQITYKPSSTVTLNYSNFYGNDKPDSLKQWRFHNNFYGIFQLTDAVGLILGFDIATEETLKGENNYNIWYTPVVIAKFGLSDKVSLTARAEYYSDEDGIIIATGTSNGFKTFSYSLNADYQFTLNALFRIEGRGLNSEDEIFILNNKPSKNNYFITTSLGISF
ncbi:MAG: porin [Saprospiraceae bacterium]|nr:porin [Saprospiraceae bacterium]